MIKLLQKQNGAVFMPHSVVLAKSGRLELGDNILRTLQVSLQPL